MEKLPVFYQNRRNWPVKKSRVCFTYRLLRASVRGNGSDGELTQRWLETVECVGRVAEEKRATDAMDRRTLGLALKLVNSGIHRVEVHQI